jgi:hypothetical protein
MENKYKDRLNGMKSKLHEPVIATIQKVVPLPAVSETKKKQPISNTDSTFTFYTNSDWLKALKQKAAMEDTTVRELVNVAIKEKYFRESEI